METIGIHLKIALGLSNEVGPPQLERVEVKTLYIEPGSPWENGYNESFNGTLGEEVLKREIFYSLEEAKVLTEQWRREYNTIRARIKGCVKREATYLCAEI